MASGPAATVLVADGNPDDLAFVETYLRDRGHRCVVANGVEDMLAHVSTNPTIEVVLVAVGGETFDGFALTSAIRARDQGKRLPICLLAEAREPVSLERVVEIRADDLLVKPLEPMELDLRVRALAAQRRMQIELIESHRVIIEQRDELLRMEAHRRDLTAMLVHDLKSPLHTILGNGRLVEDRVASDPFTHEAVADIVAAADAMHRMVLDLQDVDRAEAERLPVTFGPASLRQMLDEAHRVMRVRLEDARLHLVIELPDELDEAWLDAAVVNRVLVNLLDNSARYAPARSGIHVIVGAEDGGLRIVVADSGPGVPPDDRDVIFDRYRQLDDRHRSRGGRGLGLAFCRLAVEAHGGRIWVEENDPQGSRFVLTLPQAFRRAVGVEALPT